ncbi:MAG: F0F1 ATP synthase subunit B [Rhodospirillales bacterium]|nr:F0F1 ATP synthase subunit B [Rhodospirillales bacterium]
MHEESFFANPRTWVAIAFIVFFVVFGRKLWQPLAGLLDKHAQGVRAELAEAQRLRQEAEAMLQDARARREAALAEARALLERAQQEAVRVAQEAAADAEAAAHRRERMAMDRIAAAEKAAVDEVRMLAAEIATSAAAQAIRDGLPADADARLIDHAIGALPAALAPRQAA